MCTLSTKERPNKRPVTVPELTKTLGLPDSPPDSPARWNQGHHHADSSGTLCQVPHNLLPDPRLEFLSGDSPWISLEAQELESRPRVWVVIKCRPRVWVVKKYEEGVSNIPIYRWGNRLKARMKLLVSRKTCVSVVFSDTWQNSW